MANNGNLRFGVDLITLYDPSFWGKTDFNAFYDNEILSPDVFWDRARHPRRSRGGWGGITFGPGHWRNALARYGSAEGFQKAVNQRGLVVCSGFYTGLVLAGTGVRRNAGGRSSKRSAEYADFLISAGCDIMIAGLPMRQSWDNDPPMFVDHAYAVDLAGLINQMGYVALKRGVRLAIHPETHAVFWLRRDLDLFMALTDPVYVWFCPDTAHITTGGTNPVDVLRDHHGRVIISHWKDAKGRPPIHYPIDENIFRSHHPYFARVGSGEVDWVSWAKTLRISNSRAGPSSNWMRRRIHPLSSLPPRSSSKPPCFPFTREVKSLIGPVINQGSAGHVLSLVRSGLANTRPELARLTGISRSAVAMRVETLADAGLVVEDGSAKSTGGRRATYLRFAHDSGVVLVADLDITVARLAVTDLAGGVLASSTVEQSMTLGPRRYLDWMVDALEALLAESGRTVAEVRGIGVGLPGPVEHATGRAIAPPSMPGWDDFPVADDLRVRFGVPVVVDNDVNLMAWGEYTALWRHEASNFLFIKVAEAGVGCGIVAAGRIHHGAQGSAGAIGHIRVPATTTGSAAAATRVAWVPRSGAKPWLRDSASKDTTWKTVTMSPPWRSPASSCDSGSAVLRAGSRRGHRRNRQLLQSRGDRGRGRSRPGSRAADRRAPRSGLSVLPPNGDPESPPGPLQPGQHCRHRRRGGDDNRSRAGPWRRG